MKSRLLATLVTLALLSTLSHPLSILHAQGTAFTYQGRLNLNGNPANGNYEFEFVLFPTNQAGFPVGPVPFTNVVVNNGLFTVSLDFGSALFTGTNYWLDIYVRTNGAASFTELSPRQPITPAPYALFAEKVSSGGLTAGGYTNAVTFNNAANNFNGTFTGNGAGLTLNVSQLASGTVPAAALGNAWQIGGNSGTSNTFIGTTDDQLLDVRVNNVRVMRLRLNTDSESVWTNAPNVIGGSSVNTTATAGVVGATIAGGGGNTSDGTAFPNKVTADFGTVGGGSGNIASDDGSTVGGGFQNTASGNSATVSGGFQNTSSGDYATVGGGYVNKAGGNQATVGGGWANNANFIYATVAGGYLNTAGDQEATVGGGQGNTASGPEATVSGGELNTANSVSATVTGGDNNKANGGWATVCGGEYNTASGDYATVGGGHNNTASGGRSFAAGTQAHAAHDGSFVWADDSFNDFSSTTGNQFRVRATGGVAFVTAIDGSGGVTAGVHLLSGDTAWSSISDRNAKKNFRTVDGESVLEKLAAIPVQSWNYKWEANTNTPHMGPMAQDFKAAFYPGRDDKSISTLEFDGVELAAIQGLNRKLEEQSAESRHKDARIAALEQQLSELKEMVKKLADSKE